MQTGLQSNLHAIYGGVEFGGAAQAICVAGGLEGGLDILGVLDFFVFFFQVKVIVVVVNYCY